jgi:hypothetical protein
LRDDLDAVAQAQAKLISLIDGALQRRQTWHRVQ